MGRFTVLLMLTCHLSRALASEAATLYLDQPYDKLKTVKQRETSTLSIQELVASAMKQDSAARRILFKKINNGFVADSILKNIPLTTLFNQPIGSETSYDELGAYLILSHIQKIAIPETIFTFQEQKAFQDNRDAQFWIGWMYMEGHGVPSQDQKKNHQQAVYWYEKAAEQGHVVAQYNLGWMYMEGRGVPSQNQEENLKTSLKLFAKSAQQKNIRSKQFLKEHFSSVPLADIEDKLSPDLQNEINDLTQNIINLKEFYTFLSDAAMVSSFCKNIFSENTTLHQTAHDTTTLLTSYEEVVEHLTQPLFMVNVVKYLAKKISSSAFDVFLPDETDPHITLDGPSSAAFFNGNLEKPLKTLLETMAQMTLFIHELVKKKSKEELLVLIRFENHFGPHTKAFFKELRRHLDENSREDQELGNFFTDVKKELQEKSQEIEEHIVFVKDLNERLISLIKKTTPYRNHLFMTNVWN